MSQLAKLRARDRMKCKECRRKTKSYRFIWVTKLCDDCFMRLLRERIK